MSAFIVSKSHIDAIVSLFLALEREDSREPIQLQREIGTKIGKMLWSENHKSVNARYGYRDRTPDYRFTPSPIEDLSVAKSIGAALVASLRYQSCEHDEWKHSKANQFLKDLAIRLDDVTLDGPWVTNDPNVYLQPAKSK